MKTVILISIFIILSTGCRSREPMEAITENIPNQSQPLEIVTYTGNAIVKNMNGDPCKYAMIHMQNTYHEYKSDFYADTRGFICLKYYTAIPDHDNPPKYITTSCIIYRNQFDQSVFVRETIEVKHSDNCLDDEINSLVVVFTDSLDF